MVTLRPDQLDPDHAHMNLRHSLERAYKSLFALSDRPSIARWAPVALRLVVGCGFMQHGFAKRFRGPEDFALILDAMGVPAPHFMARLTILTELFGGLAVLAGALVPLVSVPLAAVLLVAIFTVHLRYGFSSIKLMNVISGQPQFGPPGYECDLLYLAGLAALVVGGSGPLATDGYLRRRIQDASGR
jgi:putative oxidoreductase